MKENSSSGWVPVKDWSEETLVQRYFHVYRLTRLLRNFHTSLRQETGSFPFFSFAKRKSEVQMSPVTMRGMKLSHRCSGPFKYPSKDSCYKAPCRTAVTPMSCGTQAGYALDPQLLPPLPVSPRLFTKLPNRKQQHPKHSKTIYVQLWPEVRLQFCLLPRLRDRDLWEQDPLRESGSTCKSKWPNPKFKSLFSLVHSGGWRRTLCLAFTYALCLPAPVCPRTLAQCRLLPKRPLSLSVCASSQKPVSSLSQSPASPSSCLQPCGLAICCCFDL